jgi:hypothetical protein
VAALGLLPFLYFVGHWYLTQGSPPEGWDSPLRGSGHTRSLFRRLSSRGERPSSAQHNADVHSGGGVAAATQLEDTEERGGGVNADGVTNEADGRQRLHEGERADAQPGHGQAGDKWPASPDRLLRRRTSFGEDILDTCQYSKV